MSDASCAGRPLQCRQHRCWCASLQDLPLPLPSCMLAQVVPWCSLPRPALPCCQVHASLQAYICKKLADPATAHLRWAAGKRCTAGLIACVWAACVCCCKGFDHVQAIWPARACPSSPPRPLPPKRSFELSDSTVKGEGELKILSRLLHPGGRETSSAGAGDEPASSSGSSGSGEGETHLVLGSDSDLLLMSMVSGQVRMIGSWYAPWKASIYQRRWLPGVCVPCLSGICCRRHGATARRCQTARACAARSTLACRPACSADPGVLLPACSAAVQQGVYIVGDLFEDRRHKRPHHHRRQQAQPAEQLAEQQQQQQQQQQQLQQEAAALAASLLEAAGSADTESDTESGSDSEDESEESESEPEEPQLVVPLSPDAQPAAWTVPPPLAAEHAPPPPLMAFSQDALAALWREQHLSPPPEQAAGGSSGGKGGRGRGRRHRPGREQAEVTSLALDLMLLSVMANGDDYLPAIQVWRGGVGGQ